MQSTCTQWQASVLLLKLGSAADASTGCFVYSQLADGNLLLPQLLQGF
jgi:hypothetical protein